MFKSKIEVRQFAVEQAVIILGTSTPQKDVVAKAKEIEAYVVGEAELPEVSNAEDMFMSLDGNVANLFQGIGGSCCGCHAPTDIDISSKEENTSKKK